MIILTIRTDKLDAEIGLFDDKTQLDYEMWRAHHQLAETLHTTMKNVLERNKKTIHDLQAIVVYKGPGSFTGLRIGISVANALSYSLTIPIVGVEAEENWIERGILAHQTKQVESYVLPEYGMPVHITTAKK